MISKAIKWSKKQLKKLFSKLFGREKAGQYVKPTLHAAQSKAYIETVSCKADAFHLAIKQLYEEDLQAIFLSQMNKLAPKFRRGKVRLAIDRHEIGYYGKKEGLYIVGTAYGNKSYKKAFDYITVSLLTGKKEERIHLFSLPWHIGQDMVESVAKLLKIVKPWFNKIEVVEFDRGFHNNELIYWLSQHKIPYLIHIPQHEGEITERLEQTKSFWRGKYSRKFFRKKSGYRMETNLYVCKNIRGKDWLFVSSIWFTNKQQLVNLYRNRWQIETNYAINNQNRIMSKSTNYMIRYFYFLCDIFLQVLWRIGGNCQLPFKAFLRCFVVDIKQVIEMKPAYTKPPP